MRDDDGRAAAPPARLVGLDALRGFAVALVLLNHAAPTTFAAAGVIGVTLFFALSGWLITGILLRDVERHGRVRYGRFAASRALRLYPPMLFMLAGFVVVEGVLDHLGDRDLVPESLLAALTYTMNLPYLPHGSESIYHFWTLATEEQFYLLWPLVLAWGWRRGLLRVAIGLCLLGTLAACTVTMVLVAPDVARIYALPTSWAPALLVGCAGYLGRDALARVLPAGRRARRAVLVGLVTLLVASGLAGPMGGHPWWYLAGVPGVAAAAVVLISYASRWPGLPSRLLRPAVALGTVSYAAYLWNAAIVRWLHFPEDALGATATVVLTLVAAAASWWLVERPVARLRTRLSLSARDDPRSARARRRAPGAPARTT